MFSQADIHTHSVCIVSIFRLVSFTQEESHDYAYAVAMNIIPTMLEPLLGITIACLPFVPPVIKKLTGRMDEENHPQIRNVLSSSMARMRLKRSMKSSTLQNSCGDSSPLTDLDLEAKGNQKHITGPTSGKDEYMFGGYCDRYTGVRMTPQSSSIMVEHNFEVRSDEVK